MTSATFVRAIESINATSDDARSAVVAFFLPSMAGGGAERVTLNLLEPLRRRGYTPVLILGQREGPLLDAVPDGIEIISLGRKRTAAALMPLVRTLRSRRPDVLISSLGHNNIIAIAARAISRCGAHLVICQHSTLSAECKTKGSKHAVLRPLYRHLWKYSDSIVAVSNGVASDMAAFAGIPRTRINVIYNPVLAQGWEAQSQKSVEHPFFQSSTGRSFIVVGRLVELKCVGLAISSFANFSKKPAGWQLWVMAHCVGHLNANAPSWAC